MGEGGPFGGRLNGMVDAFLDDLGTSREYERGDVSSRVMRKRGACRSGIT